jgi:hypothetical protein
MNVCLQSFVKVNKNENITKSVYTIVILLGVGMYPQYE